MNTIRNLACVAALAIAGSVQAGGGGNAGCNTRAAAYGHPYGYYPYAAYPAYGHPVAAAGVDQEQMEKQAKARREAFEANRKAMIEAIEAQQKAAAQYAKQFPSIQYPALPQTNGYALLPEFAFAEADRTTIEAHRAPRFAAMEAERQTIEQHMDQLRERHQAQMDARRQAFEERRGFSDRRAVVAPGTDQSVTETQAEAKTK